MRWWYAIKNGYLLRKNLKKFLTCPEKQIHDLAEITLEKLDNAEIAILVLDFDGVLAAHNAKEPTPQAKAWLTKMSQTIGEHRLAILTNKPKPERLAYFAKEFPSLFVLHGVRKKPYPEGLVMIAQYRGVSAHRIVLVDDRLLTGMLATCLGYTQGWYFRPPKTNYWKNPIVEAFFSFLRVSERLFIRIVG
ncbi:MAG: hypothetical protein JSR17_03985 [Proteobacteria bacterium]|nr:hypothetical protein [Pseudomonadota bacterium]